MHVTILGAGALGRVYGLKLRAQGADVAFVARAGLETDERPFVIEQVNGAKRREELDRPIRVTSVPAHTDFVLVAVRADQLEAIVPLVAAAPKAVVVVLTPMIPGPPSGLERRVIAAMPGFVGFIDDRDVVRYWTTTTFASTLLDEPRDESVHAQVEELARRLMKCGLDARLEKDVARQNLATTTAFFPLLAALDVGGGVDGALGDKELFALALDAFKECEALARKVGHVVSWAGLLTKFVGPFTLKPGIALAKRIAPEPVRFVEAHFGNKLHAQHVAMGEAILKMGAAQGEAMPSLNELMNKVKARG
jgi:ketopantoate reductase